MQSKEPITEIKPVYEAELIRLTRRQISQSSPPGCWDILQGDLLTRPPHSEWYQKGYEEYQPDNEAVNKLTAISKDNLTIKIVMGTWCPDSRREVPRFMRILDLWKFPPEKVTFIGVDNAKLSPVGEYEKLDIQRVPTFIFYKNNVEAGRIIENPVTSLEQDMVNILTRE